MIIYFVSKKHTFKCMKFNRTSKLKEDMLKITTHQTNSILIEALPSAPLPTPDYYMDLLNNPHSDTIKKQSNKSFDGFYQINVTS